MLIIERAVALAGTPTFAGLPDHVLAQVAQVMEEVQVDSEDLVVEEGKDESWMFVLVSGHCDVRVGSVSVAEVTAGSVIGELAVLDPAPRSASVIATEQCLLLRLDHRALRELMVDHPSLMTSLITTLARRLRAATERYAAELGS